MPPSTALSSDLSSGGGSFAGNAIDLSSDVYTFSEDSASTSDVSWRPEKSSGLDTSDFLPTATAMVGFNDSLSEEEAVKRAMAISLEDSVSSSASGGGGDAILRMTEEEQMRKAIEDSLKSADAAEDGPTRTHGKELIPRY